MIDFLKKKHIFLFAAIFLFSAVSTPVLAEKVSQGDVFGFNGYDLLRDSSNIRFMATSPGEQFGTSIAKGDFNGDGKQDLIVGSPFFTNDSKVWSGKVSLFWGGKKISTGQRSLNHFPPDVTFVGPGEGYQFGSSLASADINGDSISDLIIGAYQSPSYDEEKNGVGRVYILFGKREGFPSTQEMGISDPDILITGNKNEKNFGISIARGDFNGDLVDDVAISSLGAKFNDLFGTGKVHVLFGGKYFGTPRVFDLDKGPLQWTLYGQERLDYFGANLTSGDINGDSYDDILVSSYFADNGDLVDSGKIFVYFGGESKPSLQPADIRASFYADLVFSGDEAGDWFSFSTSVADVNNDGMDDAIVGSFPFSDNAKAGKVHVIYGRKSFEDKANYKASRIADLVFYGEGNGNLLGASVAAGDFNGDGKQDLLFGAPGTSQSDQVLPGKAYLYYGPFEAGYVSRLDEEYPDVTIDGVNDDDWFGNNVLAIDLDDDLVSDAAISAMYSDYKGASNTGEVFVVLGKKRPLGEFKRFVKYSLDTVERGDFVKHVIDIFGLKIKKKKFLTACMKEIEFCLFNFAAQTRFDELRFEPNMVLYSDVYPAHPYSRYINLATMLGLMHGYMTEDGSPFKAEDKITRIQALKVLLGASELLSWKYKSELASEVGGVEMIEKQQSAYVDVDPRKAHMWWYPRYVNYAYLTGVIDFSQEFRPDDSITQSELDNMIKNILKLIE